MYRVVLHAYKLIVYLRARIFNKSICIEAGKIHLPEYCKLFTHQTKQGTIHNADCYICGHCLGPGSGNIKNTGALPAALDRTNSG